MLSDGVLRHEQPCCSAIHRSSLPRCMYHILKTGVSVYINRTLSRRTDSEGNDPVRQLYREPAVAIEDITTDEVVRGALTHRRHGYGTKLQRRIIE